MTRETLRSVIQGNLATLWGRYRPTQGLSAGEIEGIGAERREFGERLRAVLDDVDAPTSRLIAELRRVFHEIEVQAYSLKMPTAEEIAGRVRGAIVGSRRKPTCPACSRLGGTPGVWSDSALGPAVEGQIPVESTGDWWCSKHLPVLTWYAHRQLCFEAGFHWPYRPPQCIIPRDAWRPGVYPAELQPFTDGDFMCPLALYVREYVESVYGRESLTAPVDLEAIEPS